MKGTMKIIAMLVVVIMAVMVISPVYAANEVSSSVLTELDGKIGSASGSSGKMTDIAAEIIAFIRNLALVLGVVMLSILGIKYMLGSAEEKASYKKTLIPLVVGIIVVMAASTLVSMIYGFTQNF